VCFGVGVVGAVQARWFSRGGVLVGERIWWRRRSLHEASGFGGVAVHCVS
jgi:hypothetical protein